MKKIGKITINPDKVIKNEELVNLRGGYDMLCTGFSCSGWEKDFYCECVNSVGAWCTCALYSYDAEAEGQIYCASGQAHCGHYVYT